MKKILYIAIIALSTGMMSCKKFLAEENISGVTSENFYTDAAGFEKLVNSVYSSMRDVYEPDPKLLEWGTDIITRGETESVSGTLGDRLVRGIQLDEYQTLSSDNSAVDDFFTGVYVGIQRCNTAISKANSIPGLPELTKTKRIAEVSFIRAYYYYLLVENFGAVPIVKDETTTALTHFVPNSEQEVYDFIIEDLNVAVNNLEATTPEFGRVTKGAAKHLLSLIYLTRGYKPFGAATDFEKSAQFAEEVISSGN